jgi:hypothetical protein
MNIGEAAAFATSQALRQNQPLAKINPDALLRTLATKHVMISFFNDVDVSANEPWIPAAQYFGTKGFFADYDVRPSAPLTRAVAEAWAEGYAKLHDKQHDGMALMRRVTEAERRESPAITGTEFSTLTKIRMPPSATLTRAEALQVLWTSSL